MKRLLLTLLGFSLLLTGQAQLIITGAFDGPLTGGTPKMVELYVSDDIADLSIYGLGSANNGGGSDSIEYSFPAVSAQQGDFLYLTDVGSAPGFIDFFGFAPTFIDDGGGSVLINGDDAIELFENGVVVDVFGDINVDGTGEPWEYLDGWAYRNDATGPDDSTFTLGNWFFSGPNALDNETSNATAATPFPLGTYSQIVVDGTASGIYLPALCLQDNATGFGDNTDASDSIATGSELNGAHAVIDGGKLYLMLTGNLETNFNKLDLFIDCLPGGQNQLRGDNPDIDFNGLNRMGDDGSGNGLTFDTNFTSDYCYILTNGVGGGGAVESFANTAPTDGSGGSGTFLGGGVGQIFSLANGHALGINNSNTAGVDGNNVNNPGAVTTGIELAIPLSEIGNPTGPVRISAFINSGDHGFLSNQVLCGLGGGQANLGESRDVDFSSIAGDQFFQLCAGVDGGFLRTEDNRYAVEICAGANSDLIRFDSSTVSGANFTYVVTDPNGIIQALPTSDEIDFGTLGAGTFLVWGLSYTGLLSATTGDDATAIALSDECFDLSSNFVTVVRASAAAGMVSTEAGETEVAYCADGNTVVAFDSMGAAEANYLYVITDPATEILAVSADGIIDFDTLSQPEVWVWGLSYTGSLLVGIGDTAANAPALSDSCFDLSGDYVVVNRETATAGTVMTESGMDTVEVCLNDNSVMRFDSMGSSALPYLYVITDPATRILGVSTDGEVDFAGSGLGQCWVWGLSYSGNLLVGVGDTVANAAALSDDCFDLSAEYVVVNRDSVDGGTVTAGGADSLFFCLTDGTETTASFGNDEAFGGTYTFVITDPATEILGLSTDQQIDFASYGAGTHWVWGLSFTGNALVGVGDVAAGSTLSDRCFDLSDGYIVAQVDTAGENCLTAVRDQAFGAVKLYPVPAQERLTVSFDSRRLRRAETQVSIYHAAGQLVQQGQVSHGLGGAENITISLADLPAGMYLLRLRNGEQALTRRFVKQ
jgi:hypothetical protein